MYSLRNIPKVVEAEMESSYGYVHGVSGPGEILSNRHSFGLSWTYIFFSILRDSHAFQHISLLDCFLHYDSIMIAFVLQYHEICFHITMEY